MLKGKKILVGVTGSIAAYKTAFLVRLLKKAEAEVRVVMTPSASQFIGPVTLATLSKNKVEIDFLNSTQTDWTNHVELGLWADLFLIVPATAATVSKMANGLCDNLLLATYLSAKCPVWLAPAMDLDMYKHPSTKVNLEKLASFGNHIIEAREGELASGLEGKGRVEEPEVIIGMLISYFSESKKLKGIKAVVTAGPTYERLDPVRFIGNHSSGKMGFAIAKSLANKGADVVLVAGPNQQNIQHTNIQIVDVESAQEMFHAVNANLDANIFVMAAAVADYTPTEVADQKMKKKDGDLSIQLKRTQDILLSVGQNKKPNQTVVGFAMETENEVQNAQGKLERKNADFIVLNSLRTEGAGFKVDTNQVTFVERNQITELPLLSKNEVADKIVEKIIEIRKHA
jgi:phosphopantothenoylcysteine decarboxylase/phosphopantothenate--cysteine ligase